MGSFYPTLVSDQLVKTVNFYEDHFGFVPTIEREGFVLMHQRANPENCLAVFSRAHECMSEVEIPVSGLIVNIVDNDVRSKYDDLYMEGLSFHRELGKDLVGADHFVVYDPNGIMVNVHAPYTPESLNA